MRNFDFLNILTLALLFSVAYLTAHYFVQRRATTGVSGDPDWLTANIRSLFPVLLIVILVRCFIFQPYRVPTGSLEPTVMPGDLIFVTQYNYGLNLPLLDKKWWPVATPQRGQIALFRWPVNPTITFVKRVIGVPGDHISYHHKVLSINGVVMQQKDMGSFHEVGGPGGDVHRYLEHLGGVQHYILRNKDVPATDFTDLVVPAHHYFMMGDNRDDSDDSRDWGFVAESAFVGRAQWVWFNINFSPFDIDWHRIGHSLTASKVS